MDRSILCNSRETEDVKHFLVRCEEFRWEGHEFSWHFPRLHDVIWDGRPGIGYWRLLVYLPLLAVAIVVLVSCPFNYPVTLKMCCTEKLNAKPGMFASLVMTVVESLVWGNHPCTQTVCSMFCLAAVGIIRKEGLGGFHMWYGAPVMKPLTACCIQYCQHMTLHSWHFPRLHDVIWDGRPGIGYWRLLVYLPLLAVAIVVLVSCPFNYPVTLKMWPHQARSLS